jgi:hypothetical protein
MDLTRYGEVARRAALLVLLAAAACSVRRDAVVDPELVPTHTPFTVLVFFSPSCHCLTAHDARLVALANEYAPRGVTFLMVDSEVRADEAFDRGEADRRRYPFPIVIDRGARVARRLGAEYASYSVVLDRQGHALYRGGIDSDRDHLHDDAAPYLRDALDDVLAGRPPRLAEGKTLGCSLQTW